MDADIQALLNEIRYAERLCQRTARFYRRAQAAATVLAVLGGSATTAALSTRFPPWVSLAGLVVLSLTGALALAVRPGDKAAANETDAKRYAQLRTAGGSMDLAALRAALGKARESDAPEIEPLRDVAFNDVAREIGRPDAVVALSPTQRLMAALA